MHPVPRLVRKLILSGVEWESRVRTGPGSAGGPVVFLHTGESQTVDCPAPQPAPWCRTQILSCVKFPWGPQAATSL